MEKPLMKEVEIENMRCVLDMVEVFARKVLGLDVHIAVSGEDSSVSAKMENGDTFRVYRSLRYESEHCSYERAGDSDA